MSTSFDVTTTNKVNWKVLPLDPDLYWMLDSEKEFFKAQTGVQTDEELKEHILEIQKLAYEIVPYPFIRILAFLRLSIASCPAYEKVLDLGRNRPMAIYLDVGAGFGTDIRKLSSDGFPVKNAVATDLHEGFWEAGHRLFKSTPETYPATFIQGDVFQLTEGINDASSSECPELASLRSLIPLKGHISVIFAAQLFHLFDEQRGQVLAERLAPLLSSEKGSLIFGVQLGTPEPVLQTSLAGKMFCHSPESWKKMWGCIFPSDTVKVEAELVSLSSYRGMAKAYAGEAEASSIKLLFWSVEHL